MIGEKGKTAGTTCKGSRLGGKCTLRAAGDGVEMAKCAACGKKSFLISDGLGACVDCLRAGRPEALSAVGEKRRQGREGFDLPMKTPQDAGGIVCGLCVRACRMAEDRRGFCGIRMNENGALGGGDASAARVQFYHDPLPTNCVADWVCPGGAGCGHPEFSYSNGPEHGYTNLAVFYEACSFDCLFCQNWHFRRGSKASGGISAATLAEAADERTACICYFGGDPGPQAPHALETSRIALETRPDRILRICWETNGSESPAVLDEMVALSLDSGGCIKFDLKAYNADLHKALCGVGNERTFSNFRRAAQRIQERPDPPLVIASTLLVPGYVDVTEVAQIARFIADTDPAIPFALLAFHPNFMMGDLPQTSLRHAHDAEQVAHAAGLTRIRIGNKHLLGDWY